MEIQKSSATYDAYPTALAGTDTWDPITGKIAKGTVVRVNE